ncbi:MAG TPA: L,D-transpeptidase [Beijerinckiaceae bacterium]|nr:L,D-transpeptidase [Beijerinckiaceae bacterium]
MRVPSVLRALATAGLLSVLASTLPASQATAREVVPFSGYSPGTVVINTNQRRLYYVVDGGRAVRYPVGVGKPGKQWFGAARIDGMYRNPAWSPPAVVRRDNPRLPDVIPGGTPGNPMGVAALTLSGGEYAIHGTNKPSSIGGFVSYGCIRMHNSDITDLFGRVTVGTQVIVQ